MRVVADPILQEIETIFSGAPGVEYHSSVKHDNPFYKHILELVQLKDEKLGIKYYFTKNSLIRDARNLKDCAMLPENDETAMSYLIIGVNYTAALAALFDARGIQYDKEALAALVKQFTEKALDRRSGVSSILGYRQYLYAYIQQCLAPICEASGLISDKKMSSAIRLLDKAKDWVGLEAEIRNIVTVDELFSEHTGNPQQIVRMDKPIYHLTMQQKIELLYALDASKRDNLIKTAKEFQEIAVEYNKLSEGEKKQFAVKPLWYECLEKKNNVDHELDLFHYYLPRILKGAMIPSQLRSRLPGLKNAFQEKLFVNDKCVSEFFHSGALTWCHKSPQPDYSAMLQTAENTVKQLNENLKQLPEYRGKILHNDFVTFCSEFYGDFTRDKIEWLKDFIRRAKSFFALEAKPYIGFDRPIVLTTRGAQSVPNFFASNICLNGFRRFEGADYKGIIQIYNLAEALLEELTDNKSSLSDQKKLSTKLVQLRNEIGFLSFTLAQLENKASLAPWYLMARLFLSAIAPIHRFIEYYLFDCRQVAGNQVMSLLARIAPIYNRNSQKFRINVGGGCASGDNRTGCVLFVMECDAVAEECNVPLEKVQARLAASQHKDKEWGGGNAGQSRLRAKSSHESMPDRYQSVVGQLTSNYSDMKDIAKDLERQAKKPPKVYPGLRRADADYFQEVFGDHTKVVIKDANKPKCEASQLLQEFLNHYEKPESLSYEVESLTRHGVFSQGNTRCGNLGFGQMLTETNTPLLAQ